jgi:hypothetical protein
MASQGLNLGGWIMLIVVWSAIISTTIFCFAKVLGDKKKKKKDDFVAPTP